MQGKLRCDESTRVLGLGLCERHALYRHRYFTVHLSVASICTSRFEFCIFRLSQLNCDLTISVHRSHPHEQNLPDTIAINWWPLISNHHFLSFPLSFIVHCYRITVRSRITLIAHQYTLLLKLSFNATCRSVLASYSAFCSATNKNKNKKRWLHCHCC